MQRKTLQHASFLPLIILFSFLIRLLAIGNISLIPEEAYYWNYANHLDFSYFDHPPMVAYLIKITTTIFGNNEFAVRLPAILCWIIAGFYSFKLSEKISRGSGIYAVFLLSILPFFFLQSVIMTPDLPLIAAWSASLYYLFQALVKNENAAWYKLGLSFGLGMLSKYTIVLLVPATFLYILLNRVNFKKLLTPYPYIASIIAIIIFAPVIYWNAEHKWASFAFQSTQRFTSGYEFSLHQILGLLILFLTPFGVISLCRLWKNDATKDLDVSIKRFLQVYTLFPLGFFMLFSMLHTTKFNWIGPGLLAIIPWVATEVSNVKFSKIWRTASLFLLIAYSGILMCIIYGKPLIVYNAFFQKFNNWDNFYYQIKEISDEASRETHKETVIVPLDKYNIASELNFYQAKHHAKSFSVYGRNIFGQDALMYNYWYKGENLADKNILIIHDDRYMLDAEFLKKATTPITPVKILWAISQGSGTRGHDYFYQIVTPNPSEPRP